MAANHEFKVRCPSCGTKYKFPASAAGRKARCAQCQSVFRVGDAVDDSTAPSVSPHKTKAGRSVPPSMPARTTPPGVPTEEDILRWLSEADDDAERERRAELDEENELAVRPTIAAHAKPDEAQPLPRLRLHRAPEDVLDEPTAMRRVV